MLPRGQDPIFFNRTPGALKPGPQLCLPFWKIPCFREMPRLSHAIQQTIKIGFFRNPFRLDGKHLTKRQIAENQAMVCVKLSDGGR